MEVSTKKPVKNKRTNKQNAGSFLMISKNNLMVDHSYQRDGSNRKIIDIAREWDWVKFGAISVSERPDGSFYVVDGQHRQQASMRHDDIDMLPCMVFEMAKTTDEARSYLDINMMKSAPTMAERFRVMVKLGDPLAMKLELLGEECGRKVNGQTNSSSISCIARLLAHMKSYPEAFDRVWPVILEVCEGESINSRIAEGMVWLEHNLDEYKSLSQPSYRRILCSIGYKALVKQIADTIKYEDKSGMTVYGQGILKALNKRLNKKLSIAQ